MVQDLISDVFWKSSAIKWNILQRGYPVFSSSCKKVFGKHGVISGDRELRRFTMTRKSQFCARCWSFTTGGYHGWLLREDWQAPNRFDTPSPLGCSLALHGTKRTSKTFPDVKIEIIITTRMVTDESLTPLPPGASCCCLFGKKLAGYTNLPESIYRWCHIILWYATGGKRSPADTVSSCDICGNPQHQSK